MHKCQIDSTQPPVLFVAAVHLILTGLYLILPGFITNIHHANALNICRVHVTNRPPASSSSRESTGQTHLDFIIFIFPSCAEAPFEKPSPQVGLADVTVAHVSRASRNIYPPSPTQIPAHTQVNSCSSIMPSLLWLILITSACRKWSFTPRFRAIARMWWKDERFFKWAAHYHLCRAAMLAASELSTKWIQRALRMADG